MAAPLIVFGVSTVISISQAQEKRKAEEKALEEAHEAQSAYIDLRVEHTETTAVKQREHAVDTMASARGQIESQMAFMGGRGARSGAAIEAAISQAEADWLEAIDTEMTMILEDLEAKRVVLGAQYNLADISSRIAYTQSVFSAFETMLGGLYTGLAQLEKPGASPGGGVAPSSQPGPSPSSRTYQPPVYGGRPGGGGRQGF